MLGEKAVQLYLDQGKGCGEAVLEAAGVQYGLGLTQNEISLFAGFRTGMGCGSTCGALTGAIAALSRKYAGREDLKQLCADFVGEFEQKLACGSTQCAVLEQKYKTEERRCAAAVELAGDALESYIDRLEGKAQGSTLTPEQIKAVKALGFLQHKGTTRFNGRIITRNGRITAQECAAIAEAAKRFGDGHMMMTPRMTVEVSGIEYDNIEPFRAYLAQYGLQTGGTGSKVRPVVSCKGTTCQYGLIDTYDLSQKIHDRFFVGYRDVSLPHKFKVAVGGCPNNCVKPNLNDLGVVGQKVPMVNLDKCRGGKKCQVESACPIKVAHVEGGKIVIDPNACNNCGRCDGKCPFGAIEGYTVGYRVYIGGRWGKKVAHGMPLDRIFTSEEEVLDVIEKTILLFRDEGIPGERLSDTVSRLGFDVVQDKLLHSELDKEAILRKTVKGGATC